ncbi:ATP-binding protein [Candidatus Bathyarchaeota archaeon]|nr:MAG: ATP-binding protein [Candidatus Bathyarchaeota archaeon]
MRIYRKEADEVQLIAFPDEHVHKGDYFVIEDQSQSRGLLVQAIDLQYANVPGVLEDILRDVMTDGELSGEDVDPLNISSQVDALKDTRLAVCKIRGTIAQDGSLSPSTSWLPSRTSSKIRPYAVNKLIMNGGKMPVKLGHNDGEPISVDASGLDGGLNIITGRKGSGKSHLAKLLLLSMAGWGAPCIVLDVNGEYINLHKSKDGRQSSARLTVLAPRSGLNFSMAKLGLRTVAGVLSHALDLPATSSKVFTTIWKDLEARGDLTLPMVIQAVQSWSCHDSVREALTSRLQVLMESGLFDEANPLTEERILHTIEGGGVLVVNLKNQSQIVRRILVEIFLGELTKILSSNWLKAAFLFAEEAHLYLRDTYWDDIVTRMRHIGLFTTFITNQPDTVQEAIYRQADNVFIFNFTNEHDIEAIGKVAKADSDTIRYLVRGIPTRRCLLLGNVVKDLPMMVDVEQLDVRTMGETRLFFS